MILTKSSRDVERARHRGSPPEGPVTWVTNYLGPISPGADGIAYMTLRNALNRGAKRMPQERELLRSGNRKPRASVSDAVQPFAGDELAATTTSRAPLLSEQPDGLGAWHYRLAPRLRGRRAAVPYALTVA